MKTKQIVKIFTGIVSTMFLCCLSLAALANGGGSANVSQYDWSKTVVTKTTTNVASHENKLRVAVAAGSLKANIQKIARRYGWRNVVWKSDEDYYWRGTATVAGADIEDVMKKILSGYPLQAIFYSGNRVLVILPRTLK